MFNRRLFLGSLVGLGLATFDVDRMLWIPGKTKIFIPRFTESQRRQWVSFLQTRDEWLKLFSQGLTWPESNKEIVLQKIFQGERRAKELGLDEKLHRIIYFEPDEEEFDFEN